MSEDPEILEAARIADASNPSGQVRNWLIQNHVATLGTTMARHGLQGFPYSSVVPFALDRKGMPVILIASIATHTANLKKDARASLFVRQPDTEGDPQKGWRITLLGTWSPVPMGTEEEEEIHARYVERVPYADGYRATHGFQYWRLEDLKTVRYIGGFGKITWIDGEKCRRDPQRNGLAEAVPGAVSHMNEDHVHNLKEMVAGRYGVQAEHAEMTHLDAGGFLVKTEHGPYHFSFEEEISPKTLRTAVIRALQRARVHS